MSVFHLFALLLEILGVMFIVWGAFHEDRLVAFEQKLKARWKRK